MIGKVQVIVSKHKQIAYIMQDRSRKQVILLEYVAIDGDMIGIQFIFKGKLKMNKWAKNFKYKDIDIEVFAFG